ncbi:MraY family glycosyltransferase [Sphaerisporangium perillae]|uniref:MraY family glycosyltransferase n=1 Tax=Sphaerisporangium perillae TaxID=2935860 RepID=UPI00200E4EFA|nr:MraY family glycosyltransferase [Sphaerisporangium perillae]
MLGRLALLWDITDRPGGHKAHAQPVPYLGGVAIVLGTTLPIVVLAGFDDRQCIAIILAATAVAVLGLIDDLSPSSLHVRLTVETMAAGGVVLSGVEASITGGWLDGPITALWIIVITNSFNLLDNMDGSLGAIATVSAACLAATASLQGKSTLALLLVTLALASLGFLRHNWAPARVFMGDAGSLFIGFVMASSAALLVTGTSAETGIAGLILPTFVAIVDTGVVLVSRKRAGRPLLSGGTDHLSHRLRHLGLSTRLTALTLAAVAAVAGTLGLLSALRWTPVLTLTIATVGVAFVLIGLAQRVHVYSSALRPNHPSKIRERR